MVAKITSGAFVFGVLRYNGLKIGNGDAEIIFTNQMIVPYGDLERLTLPVLMKSFEPYLDANRNTKKPVFHASLNPHPDDKLTDTDYNLISHEYMQKMGYGEQPYVVYKHTDIERTHLHIVSLRVDIHGKKLPHDFEAKKSMDILRELEQKYKLTPAIKGAQLQAPLTPEPVDYRKGNIKQQIASKVRAVIRNFRFRDFPTFNLLLRSLNIRAEPVKGTSKGRNYEGVLYHVLDDDGKKIGKPLKSSLIGKDVGVKAIREQLYKNKDILAEDPETVMRIRDVFDHAMKISTNRDGFEEVLKSNGIATQEIQTAPGKYSVFFIDSKSRVVFWSKELGEGYALGNIQTMLNGNKTKQKERNKEVGSPCLKVKKGSGRKL